jgi:Subtilase family/GEVED domain/Secretion system C-terminal sorting domain/Fibronectin type III domain
MKKLILLFLLLSAWTFNAQAQALDHMLGDILVQLNPGEDIRHLARQLETYNGVPTKIQIEREVSPPMRIWLVHFDFATINENYFLDEVRHQRAVAVAQFNHVISMRETVPDDPFFGQQWQWVNTGQGGGTPDADVDADEAWDLTTGGTTATGDEIVVCVLEGTNRNHPDLQGNLWFNEGEIPDNGIDDDGNGYVDDYEGWNIQTGDDNVNPESHGTTVAGMIGAKGNNGLFVSGINWDVKIMNVDFQGVSEANSLEAYTYPFVMRKRYNESGGAIGAFIVSTNASWGLDNGDPADAPLWCAFYDSLGSVGILNCGATANNNVNIDVVGDLPTACPSEYMVAVTATDNEDVRTFSGYGVENIDVGAPGAQIVSINQNGGPTTTSGTSFASPLTAGIIALLYSAPCSSLGPQALADPAGTALLVRDALYAGVDSIPNLLNEVKYGGRVNAYNSLLILLQSCGPCPRPYGITFTNVIDTSATASWFSTDSTLQTNLRFRLAGDTVWTTVDSVTSPVDLTGLLACSAYELELEDVCSDTTSGYASVVFDTDGCCTAPDVLVLSAITDTSVTATWNSVFAANSYNLKLMTAAGEEIFEGLTDTTLTLDILEPCTAYGIQIQTVCDTGATDYGTVVDFTTFGCGACTDLTYCPSNSVNAGFEWIGNVTLNTIDNTTGSDEGYGDYTGLSTDLMTYNQYSLGLTPAFASNLYDEWFKVWIDFNQNGDFNDAGEMVYNAGATTQSTVNGSIIVPASAALGSTRMRVVMQFNQEPGVCNVNFNFGEVEDYCVNILEGTPPDCVIPAGLSATGITFTGAVLNWAGVGDALDYDVRIRPTGAVSWVNIGANDTALPVQSLNACTEYEFQVRSACIGVESDWSDSYIFTTECYPPCDEIPAGLDTSGVTMNAATLHWTTVASAGNYRLRYKKTADPDWLVFTTGDTAYALAGLDSCAAYDFAVQALCLGDLESDFSDLFSFETVCPTAVRDLTGDFESFAVQPNPFAESIWLNFSLKNGQDARIELFDARGQQMHLATASFHAGQNLWQLTADSGTLSELPQGIYFVKMTIDNGYAVRKLMKR